MPIIDEMLAITPEDYETKLKEKEDFNRDFKVGVNGEIQRRYKGFWDNAGRVLVGSTISIGSNFAGTASRMIPKIKETGAMLNGMGLPQGVNEQLSQITPAEVPIEERSKKLSNALFEKSQEAKWQPGVDGGFWGFVSSAVAATGPYMTAAALSTAITGSPLGAFSVGFSVEGDNARRDFLKNNPNASEEEAMMVEVVAGTISGVVERFQIDKIFKIAGLNAASIKAIKKAAIERSLKKIGAATGKLTTSNLINSTFEGLQEVTQEWVGMLAPGAVGGKIDLEDAWNRTKASFVGGFTVSTILGGAATPFNVVDAQLTNEEVVGSTLTGMTKTQFPTPTRDGDSLTFAFDSPEAASLASENIGKISEQLGPNTEVALDGSNLTLNQLSEEEVQTRETVKQEKLAKRIAEINATMVETEDTPTGTPPLQTKTVATVEEDNIINSNIAEGRPPFEGITASRHEDIRAEREAAGLQLIPSRTVKHQAELNQEAIDKGIPGKAISIAEDVIANERVLEDYETQGLMIRRHELKKERKRYDDVIRKSSDPSERSLAIAGIERLQLEHDTLTAAVKLGISRAGSALQASQSALDQNDDLFTMRSVAKENKKAPLTEKENKAFIKVSEELDKLKDELSELQKQSREANAEKVFKAVKKQKKGAKAEMTIQEKAAAVRQLFNDGCVL